MLLHRSGRLARNEGLAPNGASRPFCRSGSAGRRRSVRGKPCSKEGMSPEVEGMCRRGIFRIRSRSEYGQSPRFSSDFAPKRVADWERSPERMDDVRATRSRASCTARGSRDRLRSGIRDPGSGPERGCMDIGARLRVRTAAGRLRERIAAACRRGRGRLRPSRAWAQGARASGGGGRS